MKNGNNKHKDPFPESIGRGEKAKTGLVYSPPGLDRPKSARVRLYPAWSPAW
jgi:hypothetical protein